MKKILAAALFVFLLTGCAAIMKYSYTMDLMKTYTFNVPPDAAYSGAVDMFNRIGVHIDSSGRNRGESEWASKKAKLGDKIYTEMTRFMIAVTPAGDRGSIVHISRQSQSNLTGGWVMGNPARDHSQEYTLLQKLDPAGAAEIDRKAASMAGSK